LSAASLHSGEPEASSSRSRTVFRNSARVVMDAHEVEQTFRY
jgi:hypothetical protein